MTHNSKPKDLTLDTPEVEEDQQVRDESGACVDCFSLTCCEHDQCGDCWSCLGISQGDYL